MENEKYWEDLLTEFEKMSDEDFLKTVQKAEEQIPEDLFCEFFGSRWQNDRQRKD